MGCVCGTGKQQQLNQNLMRERQHGALEDVYDLGNAVGQGSMGAVSTITHRSTNKEYALKTIQLARVSAEFLAELRNEIAILRALDHPGIVRPLEVWERKRQIFFVMELCRGGDLYARAPYTEEQARHITAQIVEAIRYLHARGIAHRDLKFENILYESTAPDARVKLIDFGLSKSYNRGTRMEESVGTLYSMAPEVLRGSYTEACDMWSIGVLAFMLLVGRMPFEGPDEFTVVTRIHRADWSFDDPRWMNCSDASKSFVAHLLRINARKRYTAEQALESRWLRDRNSSVDTKAMPEGLEQSVAASLQRFGTYSKLKKAALMIVAHQTDTQQLKALRDLFYAYDTDRTGMISLSELREALADQHFSDAEMTRLFQDVDVDHSGRIHYTEFLAATLECKGYLEEERLAEAFDRLDSDDSGFITKANLKEILGADYDAAEVEEMISKADFKHTGKLDFEEFLALMRSQSGDDARQVLAELPVKPQPQIPADVSAHENKDALPYLTDASSHHATATDPSSPAAAAGQRPPSPEGEEEAGARGAEEAKRD